MEEKSGCGADVFSLVSIPLIIGGTMSAIYSNSVEGVALGAGMLMLFAFVAQGINGPGTRFVKVLGIVALIVVIVHLATSGWPGLLSVMSGQ